MLVRFIHDDGVPLYEIPQFTRDQGRYQHYHLVQTRTHGQESGQRGSLSALSGGVLELECIWMHCQTGLLQRVSTSEVFPPCYSRFLLAEQKSLVGLGDS